MDLTTDDITINLSTYYQAHPGYQDPCENSTKTCWLRFTPYDFQETVYYLLKNIALPTVAVVLLILITFFRLFNLPILDTLIFFLGVFAVIILFGIGREKARAKKYKIPDDEKVMDIYDYIIEEVEQKFKIPSNNITNPIIKIGFVGDIMMMKEYGLQFSDKVKEFFNDVDLIVGNLEGIVSVQKCPPTKQRHLKDILGQLKSILQGNTKWLLCLSNNHSIDYGNVDLHNSIIIDIYNELGVINAREKFYLFGRNDVPNVKVKGEQINIYTSTEWSNQKKWDCITKYEDQGIKSRHRADHFNILYPHWGYEAEKYVRSRIQKDAKALLTGKKQTYSLFQRFIRRFLVEKITHSTEHKWDFIFGHHPHVRQPIMKVYDDVDKIKKFVAFCGGNFTSSARIIRKKKHIYGILLKFDIGTLRGANKLAAGNVEWRRTVNEKIRNQKVKEVRIDTSKYRTFNINTLIIGIVMLALSVILSLINIFF